MQVILVMLLMSSLSHADQPFWYAEDGPVELWIDSSLLLVRFDKPVSDAELNAFVSSVENIDSVVRDEWRSHYFVMCALKTKDDFDVSRQAVTEMDGVYKVEPVYRSHGGNPRIVTGGIFVKFASGVTKEEIDEINAVYGVEIDHVICGPTNSYRISNTRESVLGDIDLANTYHSMKQTVFAHPDFLLPVVAASYQLYDYYHQYQWHIKKITGDFNNATVWDFARVDSSITVAVVDQGVAPHEDLPEEGF